MNPHCRIGRVTRKVSGASIVILRPKNDGSATETLRRLDAAIVTMKEHFHEDAAGYALVVWNRAGQTSRAFVNQACSPYGVDTARLVVSAVLSRDTTEEIVVDTFNRK